MTQPHIIRILRPLMTFTLTLLAAVALTVASPTSARAQSSGDDWKTLAVFAMTSTDEGAPIIKRVLTAAGHEGILDEFEQQQREAFEVLDFSQPKGIVWQTDGRAFRFLGFAAMSDMTGLPYGIGEMIADAETTRDGWSKIALPDARQMPVMFQNVFAKQADGWAWFCYGVLQPPAELPSDPVTLLEGLPDEYPMALRLNCGEAPVAMLNTYALMGKQLIPMIKMFMPMTTSDGDQQKIMLAYFDFLEVTLKESIDQTVKFVKETETVTFGLHGNDDNDLYITWQIITKPDTDTAKAFQLIDEGTTELAGFFQPDDAIISYVYGAPIADYQKAPLKKTYLSAMDFFNVVFDVMRQETEEYGPDEAPEAFDKVETLLAKLPGVIEKTIDAGKIDCAVSMSGFNSISVFKIAGGNELLEPANELFDFAQLMILQEFGDSFDDFSAAPMLKSETYKGIRLWTFGVQMAMFMIEDDFIDDEEEIPWMATYVFGLSDDLFLYGGGSLVHPDKVLASVKSGIDALGESRPMPEEWMVFSPHNTAQTIKEAQMRFSYNDLDDDFEKEFDARWGDIPKDANIVVTHNVDGNVYTQTVTVSGKLWPVVGKLIELANEESGGMFMPFLAPPGVMYMK